MNRGQHNSDWAQFYREKKQSTVVVTAEKSNTPSTKQILNRFDLDVVLIIDRSCSMSDNDRQKLRIQGARLFVDRLRITDPGGNLFTPGTSGANYGLIEIPKPIAGRYSIQVEGVDVPIIGEHFELRVGCSSSIRLALKLPQTIATGQSVAIDPDLTGLSGTPHFKVTGCDVTAPDGKTIVSNPSVKSFIPTIPGDYQVRYRIEGILPSGDTFSRVAVASMHAGGQPINLRSGRVIESTGSYFTIDIGTTRGARPGLIVLFKSKSDPGGKLIGKGRIINALENQCTVELQQTMHAELPGLGTPVEIEKESWMGDL